MIKKRNNWKNVLWLLPLCLGVLGYILVSFSDATAQTNSSGGLPACPTVYSPRGQGAFGVYNSVQASVEVNIEFARAIDDDGLDEGFGLGIKGYTLYVDDDEQVLSEAEPQGRQFQSFETSVTDLAGFVVNDPTAEFPGGSLSRIISSESVNKLSADTRYYWAVEVLDDEGTRRLCPPGTPNTFVTVRDPDQGPIVGTSFEYPTETILYDARIFTNPPPGFTDERFTLPRTLEGVPN